MTDLQNLTGEIQELKGYPIEQLVECMPTGVTQFTAILNKPKNAAAEWVINYVKPV